MTVTVLVTGAGLLGAHAAAALAAEDRAVTLVDAAPNAAYVRSVVASADVRLERCDVTDLAALVKLAIGAEAVVHTAGVIGPVAQADPYAGLTVNVVGALNVAEAARRVGARRVVYASTHGVYDWGAAVDGPMTESWPTDAASVYAASKLSAEHALQAYSGVYGLDVIVLRFSNLFGRGLYTAGSRGGEAFNELVTKAVAGETARILPPLAGQGEWLYAKDAARAVAAAVDHEERGGFTVVNVGSGELVGPDDIVAAIRAVLPDAAFVAAGAPGRERRRPFDLAAARRVLGWEPAYTLRSAVADYVAEVRVAIASAGDPLELGAPLEPQPGVPLPSVELASMREDER